MSKIYTATFQFVFLLFFNQRCFGQDAAIEKISGQIRELVRSKNGVASARDAGFEICGTDPDYCPILSLLLSKELRSLGTPDAYSAGVELLESLLQRIGKNHGAYILALDNLAELYATQGKYDKAEPFYVEALEIHRAVLGDNHADTATSLNNLAMIYTSQGKYQKAEPLYVEALEIRRTALGAKHPDTATSLNNLAGLYESQGKYDKAEPLFVEALKIYQTALGFKHPNTATSLNNLAELYKSQGKFDKAEPLFVEALEIRRKALGATHPNTATSLNNLAGLYESQGKYDKAEPLFVEALKIYRTALGVTHPNTATSLNNLAGLYKSQGKYDKAEPSYVEALEIRRSVLGAKHPDTATSLNNLAVLYDSQGNYGKAEPLLVEALEVRRISLGDKHPITATSLNNLAGLYQSQGKYDKAEPLFVEALEISQRAFGDKHPDTATSLNNLGALYEFQGKYEKAEPLYVETVEIRRALLGDKHPDTATSLNNLAALYESQGKYDKAEPLFVEALEIRRAALGDKHPDSATSLNNLAELYRSQEKYTEAERLLVEAMEICRMALGAKHPDTATSLNNLAGLYAYQGKYDKAEPLYLGALEIDRMTLGDKHPRTAALVNNLAGLYRSQGKYDKAEPLYAEALGILRAAMGKKHPNVAASLNNLAGLYESQGKHDKSERLLLEALEIEKNYFESVLSSKNESERRSFLRLFRGHRDGYLSHALLLDSANGNAELAVGASFLYKGIRLQAARETQSYLESQTGSATRNTISKSEELERSIAQVRARLNRMPASAREAARPDAEKQIRSFESEVSNLRVEYLQDAAARKMQGRVDMAGLQLNLKTSEAFLEIEFYQEFLPKAKGTEKTFGDYRYGAIVFRKSGEPVLVNLGNAGKINKLLSGLRDMSRVEAKNSIWDKSNDQLKLKPAREIADHKLLYQAKLKELWKLVLEPVETKLGAAEFAAVKSWVICPDGPLHGLAWETLIDGQGRYLRQRVQVRYVESPRAFVHRNEERATGKPLYVHTPDYGNGKAPSASAAPGMWSAGLAPMQRGGELGKTIQGLHADVEILTGAAASEEKLRKLENRREVVIYTHGEYVEGPMSTNEEMGRVRIALAGAAKGMGKPEELDGTLTASDVAGWRLRGAELVALVGCETGVGSGDVGEGLQGMRRALYLAGSKWQLLSLWTVVDAAAEIWMEQFYNKRKLNPKLGIPEVVDLVQKDFLSGKVKPKRADGTDLGMDHPLLWAAMTLNGQ